MALICQIPLKILLKLKMGVSLQQPSTTLLGIVTTQNIVCSDGMHRGRSIST
jgi:hypothetical protein